MLDFANDPISRPLMPREVTRPMPLQPLAVAQGPAVLLTVGLDPHMLAVVATTTPRLESVEHTEEVFGVLERTPGVAAIIVRHRAGLDPLEMCRILRANGDKTPVFVLGDSRMQARWFGTRTEQAPIFGLSMPLDDVQLECLAVARRASRLERAELGLTGQVDQEGLASLMLGLHARCFSGVLELSREDSTRRIHFCTGDPIYAESNLLAENFGQFLLARGVIGEVEYNWARRLQEREGIRQGEALVKIGVLTNRGLFRLLRDQIRSKIRNAFVGGVTAWRLVPASEGVTPTARFDLDIFELIVDGLWQFESPEAMAERWSELATRQLVTLPMGQRLLGSVREQLPRRFWHGVADGRTIGELFDVDQSPRRRLAIVRALQLGELAVVCDEVPAVLREQHTLVVQPWTGRELELRKSPPTDDELEERICGKYLELQGADHFDALGVEPDVGQESLATAYQRLVARFPRSVPGSPELEHQLQVIHERLDDAWNALRDPDDRAAYAAQRADSGERTERRTRAVEAEDAWRRGVEALEAERHDAAARMFREAQRHNAQEPLYVLYEGWALVRSSPQLDKNWQRGRHLINRALGINPLMATGYYFLARLCLEDENHVDEARENLRVALRIDPGHAEASELMGRLAVHTDVEASGRVVIDLDELPGGDHAFADARSGCTDAFDIDVVLDEDD